MAVFVDDMEAPFGRMIMCHLLADTEEELHVMADRIGVKRKWHQGDHYDICLAKRALAVEYGAKQITWREAGKMVFAKRVALAKKIGRMAILNKYKDPIHKDAINIMRPSVFGNPYRVDVDGPRAECVRLYEVWLRRRVRQSTKFREQVKALLGHPLLCCCAPRLCHGEPLKKVCIELYRGDFK